MKFYKTLLVAALAFSGTAQATQFVLNSNLLTGQTYSGAVSGSFNLASQLDAPMSGYRINSATLQFGWRDDATDGSHQISSTHASTVTGSYGGWYDIGYWGDPDYGHDRRVDYYYNRTHKNDGENVSLSLSGVNAGSTGSSFTGNHTTVSTVYDGKVLTGSDQHCGAWFVTCQDTDTNYHYDQRYSTYTDTYSHYDGVFGQSVDLVALGGPPLTQFIATGLLPFTLNLTGDTYLLYSFFGISVFNYVAGDAILESAVLTVDVARVPEPATVALLGLGLAGIGFSRRRRH